MTRSGSYMSQDAYLGGQNYSAGALPLATQQREEMDMSSHYNTYGVSEITCPPPLHTAPPLHTSPPLSFLCWEGEGKKKKSEPGGGGGPGFPGFIVGEGFEGYGAGPLGRCGWGVC